MNYIFDFDGTLADSLPAFIAVFNKTVRNNKNPITAEEINHLRSMSLRKAIKHLGIRWWQVPKLLVQGIPDFHALVPGLKSFKGVPEVIKELDRRGDKLYIVTSNTRESVDVFLEKNKLAGYFIDITANAGLFNKSKYIRKLMKRNNLKRKDCIYIGDEARDIQAARLAVIKIASVTWGFNDIQLLRKNHPTYLIEEPSQLLNLKKKSLRK